jgi:hypothetical protein
MSLPIQTDITDEAQVSAVAEATLQRFGRLDCLDQLRGPGSAGLSAIGPTSQSCDPRLTEKNTGGRVKTQLHQLVERRDRIARVTQAASAFRNHFTPKLVMMRRIL